MFNDMYYDKRGKAISREKWRALFENFGYRKIGQYEINKVQVSTVWLGLDHGYRSTKPIIFETMVFGGLYDQEQERYATLAEAQAGHARWVKKVMASEQLKNVNNQI